MLLPRIFFPSPAIYGTSAEFDPSSLSPVLWFDGGDASTMYQERTGASATTPSGVGDPVGSWQNKGSAGGWVTSPSDSKRPVRQSDGSLLYDGVDDGFDLSSPLAVNDSGFTIYFSFNRASTGIFSINLSATTADSNPFGTFWYNSNNIYQNLGDSLYADIGGNTSTGSFVSTNQRNSSTQTYRLNGAIAYGPSSVDASSHSLAQIGYRSVAASEVTSGKIFQIVVFNSEHTGTDLSNMESWCASKNGASW